MIDALLGLTRVAAVELKRAPTDLAEIARELVDEMRSSSDRPVDFICPASMPASCDPVLARLMLRHLLANAWKFAASERSPRVEFGCQTGGRTTYFVRDNGVGFDSTSAPRLFGVFQRLHHASDFPGTGIGLATSRRIVQKHGGEISAQSQPGQGATFYFTLEPAQDA
jgi:signal transduction histidine kinase